MPRGRPRKTRVTRAEVIAIKEEVKREREITSYKRKKNIIPGPWTDIDPSLKIKAKLRAAVGILGKESSGTYPKFGPSVEKGWYLILFNIMSRSIKRDIEEHGIDNYVAACEKSINDLENQNKYGHVIFLKVAADNSQCDDSDHRFLSCYAKTTKKSISGFNAMRQEGYIILP